MCYAVLWAWGKAVNEKLSSCLPSHVLALVQLPVMVTNLEKFITLFLT